MTKKSSTVIKGINKKTTKSSGEKVKKPANMAPKEEQTKGTSTTAPKSARKKLAKKQVAPKYPSIEQELGHHDASHGWLRRA